MKLRTSLGRLFSKTKPKKNKHKWQYFDEFRKEWSMGYFVPRNSLDQNPDPWITPEKVRLFARLHENLYNTNHISVPMSKEDKERYGKFHMNYQYYRVRIISTKGF
jgi:hypothetical protein